MANRVFIPTEPSNKRFWLEEIIRNLADKEIKTSNPDIKHIYHTIDQWEKSGFEKGYPIEKDTEVRISKDDIIEVLTTGEYRDSEDPLGLFLIGTLLDKSLYAHDVLSGVPEYKDTAAKRTDAYLKTNDSAYITSKANARDYIELLTPSSIKYFLKETNNKSVEEYDRKNKTIYATNNINGGLKK